MGLMEDGAYVLAGLHQMAFCHNHVKHVQTVPNVLFKRYLEGCPVRRDGQPP